MPFRGRAKNGSQVLGRYLQARHGDDVVRVLDMPVRWGAVESIAGPVIQSWRPDLILGLGEGGQDALAIETLAVNAREGEDVDGHPPPRRMILDDGEAQRRSRLVFAWANQMALATAVKLSISAGTYLCNNALYIYSGSTCERIGFVHVPPQSDENDADYCSRLGPVLAEIVRQNRA